MGAPESADDPRWDPLSDAMEVMRRQTGSAQVTYADVEHRAVELRTMGMSYADIAAQIGLFDVTLVSQLVEEGSMHQLAEEAPTMRRLMVLRNMRMVAAVMPYAVPGEDDTDEEGVPRQPSLQAIETVLKVDAATAKLVGLNAPEQVRIGPPEKSEAATKVDDVATYMDLVDAMVDANTPRPAADPDAIDVEPVDASTDVDGA